ncbi:MAG: hypothetical protein F6K14_23505 [Symploca sp. SIO2C1]|nr:hypothetical protein [Symploca sp. SIO2C1]
MHNLIHIRRDFTIPFNGLQLLALDDNHNQSKILRIKRSLHLKCAPTTFNEQIRDKFDAQEDLYR